MMEETAGTAAQLAGFWRRFASLIIDAIIVGVIGEIIQLIFAHGDSGRAVAGILSFFIGLAYYVWGYGTGQTLGCRVLSLRIVDQNTGEVPGYGKGVIRYLVAIVSAIVVLLGFLWMLWDKKRQTWHDKAAGTLVINTSDARSNEVTFDAPGAGL